MKKKQIIGLVVAAALFVGISAASVLTNTVSKRMIQSSVEDAIDLGGSYQFNPPSKDYIAIVKVEGTIQEQTESSVLETSGGYQHDTIKESCFMWIHLEERYTNQKNCI